MSVPPNPPGPYGPPGGWDPRRGGPFGPPGPRRPYGPPPYPGQSGPLYQGSYGPPPAGMGGYLPPPGGGGRRALPWILSGVGVLVLLVAFVLVIGLVAGSGPAQGTAREAAQSYVDALNATDAVALEELTCERLRHRPPPQSPPGAPSEVSDPEVRFELLSVTEQGSDATAQIGSAGTEGRLPLVSYRLVREGEQWFFCGLGELGAGATTDSPRRPSTRLPPPMLPDNGVEDPAARAAAERFAAFYSAGGPYPVEDFEPLVCDADVAGLRSRFGDEQIEINATAVVTDVVVFGTEGTAFFELTDTEEGTTEPVAADLVQEDGRWQVCGVSP